MPQPTGPRRDALYHRLAARRQWRALLVGAVVGALLPTLGLSETGPLGAPNLAPQHLFLLEPGPDSPAVAGPGTTRVGLELAYASMYVNQREGQAAALLDMEIARANLRLARGVGGFELGAEVPFFWMGAGSFDVPMNRYHDFMNLPTGGRDAAPKNRFAYRVRRGAELYEPDGAEKAGLGDVRLQAKAPLAGGGAFATRGVVKLPTGSRRTGFGSGHADASLGLLGASETGLFRFWGNLDAVYLGGSPDPALPLARHWAVAVGGATAVSAGWLGEVHAELQYFLSPYDTGLRTFDRDVVLLALGLARPVGQARLSFGFTEDLAAETSPDIALFLRLSWGD